MRLLGNIVWWIFGGWVTAVEYLMTGLVLCITIIGIPWGLQCFKLARMMLFPFHTRIVAGGGDALSCLGNIAWLLIGGIWIALTHLLFGVLLCITIVGIPFGLRHFELARLALTPFGKELVTDL